MSKLTLADIVEPRAYERERDDFRAHVVALKKKRRVGIGPHVTLVFENRDTIRFQIQEMARVEKIFTDEGIQTELDIYNALLPGNGRLSATLFIELTSDAELREWLPKLVGIERSIELRFGDHVVASVPESAHDEQLTREEITAAVHYIEFQLDADQVDALGSAESAELAVVHPAYQHVTALGPETRAELADDARSA
ncbi:MAG: DUF3501 family protein [Acidimicrobiales bacterium]|nr:DUF3501 family protein [Acidimicrobiales bacterium]